jgi:hypothetical protein
VIILDKGKIVHSGEAFSGCVRYEELTGKYAHGN